MENGCICFALSGALDSFSLTCMNVSMLADACIDLHCVKSYNKMKSPDYEYHKKQLHYNQNIRTLKILRTLHTVEEVLKSFLKVNKY